MAVPKQPAVRDVRTAVPLIEVLPKVAGSPGLFPPPAEARVAKETEDQVRSVPLPTALYRACGSPLLHRPRRPIATELLVLPRANTSRLCHRSPGTANRFRTGRGTR